MSKIFISYRHSDSEVSSGRIYDKFISNRTFKRSEVFMDVVSIPPGEDFRVYIEEFLSDFQVVLPIIGPTWLNSVKNGKRRLHDPNDMLRIEIETALRLEIRIIPLLVQNATMPTEEDLPDGLADLARKNAILIRSGTDFHKDMNSLIKSLKSSLKPQDKPSISQGSSIQKIEISAFVQNLEPALDSRDDDVRFSAVQTLHVCSEPGALIVIARHLNHSEPKTRRMLAAAASNQASIYHLEEALPPLAQLLYSNSDYDTRLLAIHAIEHTGTASAVRYLEESLTKLNEVKLIWHAIGSLGNLGSQSSIPVLLPFLNNSSFDLVYIAALALLKTGDSDILKPVLDSAIYIWQNDQGRERAKRTEGIIFSGLVTFAADYNSDKVLLAISQNILFSDDPYLKYLGINVFGRIGMSSDLRLLEDLSQDERFQEGMHAQALSAAKQQIKTRNAIK